ncbi:MAB_1171c family putative transporter [Streptomyces cucumeris]|uniref:MAB_1171c family putative transporter n=1 Tax=Streptomyces cucumeris TaxID=2962890 RepID=UPI003EBFA192
MTYQALAWCCVTGGMAAFLYKVPGLVGGRTDPARIALCVYFLATCLYFAVSLEPFRSLTATLVGPPGAVLLFVEAMVIVLTAAQQVVLVHWADPPESAARKARRRIAGYGIALLTLSLAFVLLELPRYRVHNDADMLRNLRDPCYATLYLAHLALYAVGQFETGRRCLHYARIAGRPWLSRGMWAVTAGSVCILCYCVMRSAETLGTWLGSTTLWSSHWWVTGSMGPLLQIFGWTVPCWGPRGSAAYRCATAYWSYQRLRPLWEALYRITPDIALEPPRSRFIDLLPRRGLSYRLYRRVIEIRDGQLSLRSYRVQADEGPVADRQVQEITVAQEAAMIMADVRARMAGSSAVAAPSGPHASFSPQRGLSAETHRLTQVARAFRRLQRQPLNGLRE